MFTAKISLSKKAEDSLKAKIAEAVGKKARKIMMSLHTKILAHTPMNTGRTLGSWYGSASTPVYFDAESKFGEGYFSYTPATTPDTNHLPVGAEPGREVFEKMSLSTTESIAFERNPYRKYFITNAAALDPIGNSGLGMGRAQALEYGAIAGYDLYSHPNGDFIFQQRGTLGVQMSMLSLLRDWRGL